MPLSENQEINKIKRQTELIEAKKKALEAFGEYTDEMEKLEKTSITKAFADLFEEATKPIIVYVPELGCNVQYGQLTVQDLMEIDQIENKVQAGQEILFRMWQRGDETVTKDKFNKMPSDIKNAVMEAVFRKTPFLQLNQQKEL